MKKTLYLVFIMVMAVLLAGCYMVQDPTQGDVALNVNISSRGLTGVGTNVSEVYIVGFLVDASVEKEVRSIAAEFQSGQFSFTSDDIFSFVNLVLSSLQLFDGGNPFFQVPINTLPGASGSGSFTLAGIPAGKDYFMVMLVLNRRISNVLDLIPENTAAATGKGILAVTNMRYVDAAADNYSFSDFANVEHVFETGTNPLPSSGWYYFKECTVDESGHLGGLIWTQSGVPVKAGPYRVKAGETTNVPVFLNELGL